MDSNIKLSNVIGAPFQSFILKQLDIRTIHNSSQDRNLEEILFLANKTAWVRLMSSVDVIGRSLNKVDLQAKTYTPYEVSTTQIYKALGAETYTGEDGLAKNWLLEAGTSTQNGNGINLRSGIGANNATGSFNTVNTAYGLGGTQELGFVPMPGLTSVTVETLGRLGSLRQANINFRVNNLNQLNTIEALYFRLGYSMILEWGHTQYYTNPKEQSLSTFKTSQIYGIDDPFKNNLTKEDIINRINAKTRDTDGNYGGMYGIVTGFNWNATQDGGYDCTLKLIGHGAIMDSLKTNQSYTLPAGDIAQYQRLEDYILDQIAKDKQRIEDLKKQLEAKNSGEPVVIDPPDAAPKNLDELWNLVKKYRINKTTGAPIAEVASFKEFLHNFGYPIPDRNVFIPTQGDVYKYNLDNRANQKDFVVYVGDFPEVPDPTLKAGLVRKFSGYYIQHGSQFLRVTEKDTLGGTLDLTELDYQLGWAYANVPASDGTNFESGYLSDVRPQQAISAPFISKLIVAAAYKKFGSDQKSGANVPLDDNLFYVNSKNVEVGWPGVAADFSDDSFVRSLKYGSGLNYIGRYDFKLQIKVDGEYAAYRPTANQIADAFTAFQGSTSPVSVTFPVLRLSAEDTQSTPFGVNLYNKYRYNIQGSILLNLQNIPYSGLAGSQENAIKNIKLQQGLVDENNVAKNVPVIITITTQNLGPFSNFTVNGAPYSPAPAPPDKGKNGDNNGNINEGDTSQKEAPEGFSSALQAMLTIVQTQSQAAALKKSGVYVHNILETTRKFYTDGALNNVFDAKGNTTAPDLEAIRNNEFKLLNYAIKGFNSAIMGDSTQYEQIPFVDFKTLCQSYVIKYKQGGLEGVVASVRSPTFITLGYLLAFLNNMCLIYDSNKSRKKTTAAATSTGTGTGIGTKKHPFIYIDFNPKTNFCFTSPQQFSIDPTICMVPMNCEQAEYEQIFGNPEIVKNLSPKAFQVKVNNTLTKDLADKGLEYKTDSSYRGNLMNILINTQYLLDLCLQMAKNDPEHAVNLKPFLDQILVDINKCLGGVNSFRASYIDDSNVIQLVDDQWVPMTEGTTANGIPGQNTALNQLTLSAKKATDPSTSGELPLASTIPSPEAPGQVITVGSKSLTREFRFNTLISSKLASKIAISAQAETGSVNSKDHSSYSHLNTFYEDRYSRSKEDPSTGNTTNEKSKVNPKGLSSNQQAADLFNVHVQSLYSAYDQYTPKNIEAAKNYYLEKMSKVKSSNPLTSASPYVSLELEMTVDGISGILMGNAFTIPNDRLPYTFQGDQGKTKVAFIVTGLVHTIQNNEWLTRIKGQMIKLKTPVLIQTATARLETSQVSLLTLSDIVTTKPWSGAFISYVMESAAVSGFPANALHTAYAQSLRDNNRGFEILDPSKTEIKVGDLIVANREGNNQTFATKNWTGKGHGDIVVEIGGGKATVVGGNVSNAVSTKSLGLTDGRLGKSDYYVILRPPQDKVTSIVDIAMKEYNEWKKQGWKETSPEALPSLKKYYKTVGITI